MSPFLCSLASGSLGNALLVASNGTRLLVDMGLSPRRVRAGLRAAGATADDLDAVLLTHTHRDHFAQAAVDFCLAHATPIYSTEENLAHLAATLGGFRKLAAAGLARPLDDGPIQIGDVRVEAFDVPHDSPGRCMGFRLAIGPARRRRIVALATDLGHVPDDCVSHFLDADAVVLESNHDPEMLRESRRPADLKARIAGPRGHLSNPDAAEALAEIIGRSHAGRVREVLLAHLSRDCNTPRLALAAQAHLACRHGGAVRIRAATQYDVGPKVDL